jgi:hypothetical protein
LGPRCQVSGRTGSEGSVLRGHFFTLFACNHGWGRSKQEDRGVLGGLFGKSNPWPRHSDAPKPPDFLASDVLAGRFRNSMLHPQKGNHVALLRFSRHGGGIELRITYWPIRLDTTIGKPQEVGPLQLTIM